MGFILKRKNKGNKEELLKSKRDIVLAEFMIEQHYRVFTDSLKLLETTTSPSTFFGRYNDLLSATQRIQEVCSKANLKDAEQMGLEIIDEITSEETKTEMIMDFIDRCIAADKEHVLAEEMPDYKDNMTKESIEYYIDNVGEL